MGLMCKTQKFNGDGEIWEDGRRICVENLVFPFWLIVYMTRTFYFYFLFYSIQKKYVYERDTIPLRNLKS